MKRLAGVETTFDFLAEHTRDVIVRCDPEGRMTYVSPSIRLFGREPHELLGTTGIQFVHPEDQPRFWRNSAAMMRGEFETADRRQHRFLAGNGEWTWMEGNPVVIRGDDGEAVEFVNVFRNVNHRRKLEEAAREQAELFEAAFRDAAIGVVVIALDGRFLKVNPAFSRILGYPVEELAALDIRTITHPDDMDIDREDRDRLRRGEIESFRVEKRYLRGDGEYVWASVTGSVVRHPDGSSKHFVAQVEDLTEQKAARAALTASEARYRLIAENTSDMIVMTDLKGVTRYVSPAARRTGHDPQVLVGGSFAEHTHPDDVQPLQAGFARLLQGGPAERLRWRGRHGETGDWIWLESNAAVLRDAAGKATGVLDVIRDVTHQVQQEAALAAARAEAEAATAAKSQFLANMSHEIRTPLTAVLGFTSLLSEMAALDPTAAGYVARIAGAGNGLLAIVNDILDFSKLEAGMFEVRPRPTELAAVCEETLQLFTGQAEAKGLALAFRCDPAAQSPRMLDGDRLRQTLINLVGNAVKFTEAGSVTVAVRAGEADEIVVEVEDTGPGLDDQAQALLFQRFTQVDDSMTRRHGGTGLGLAICKGIAEAMGGSIAVESRPGEGATFRLTLPAPPAELPQGPAGEAPAGSIAGVRVFVVDDNAANRELARKVLEAAGAEVAEACDGLQALERLAVAPVDVVLMDLRMPGLDGRQTLAELRGRPGPNRDVPVLAFTADAELGSAGGSAGGAGDLGGFDGLVRKPIQPFELYAAIAQAAAWSGGDEDLSHAAAH